MHPYQWGALALGLICVALSMWGAGEAAYKAERTMSYLVLAAPAIAAAVGLIPVLAEATWKHGARVKSLLWWLVLIPAAAVVFYAAAERVHVAKAVGEAERVALRNAAARAKADLATAEAALTAAKPAASRARAQKDCGPLCRTALDTERVAQSGVEAAKGALLQAEKQATSDSPLQAPVWLLPVALDLVSFASIWSALGSGVPRKEAAPSGIKRTRRRKRSARPSVAKPRRIANDNIVPLRPGA